MTKQQLDETSTAVTRLEDLASLADYSLVNTLNSDPDATVDGEDYRPRQVFTGHYVTVKPTPIAIELLGRRITGTSKTRFELLGHPY